MRRQTKPARLTRLVPLLALLAVVGAVACAQPTGAERVAAQRAEYVATLNSFNVIETPLAPAAGEAGEMGGEGMEADAGDEGMEEAMPVEVRQDVMLDVVLTKEGRSEGLDGVTIDVYQVDSAETEKARYRIYVETGGLVNGSSKQVTHVLEDVDYAAGDGFRAEVRQNLSPQSQADYREFDLAGGEG